MKPPCRAISCTTLDCTSKALPGWQGSAGSIISRVPMLHPPRVPEDSFPRAFGHVNPHKFAEEPLCQQICAPKPPGAMLGTCSIQPSFPKTG